MGKGIAVSLDIADQGKVCGDFFTPGLKAAFGVANTALSGYVEGTTWGHGGPQVSGSFRTGYVNPVTFSAGYNFDGCSSKPKGPWGSLDYGPKRDLFWPLDNFGDMTSGVSGFFGVGGRWMWK